MSGSAIAISLDHQFSPKRQRTRLAEIARYALTQSRRILSDGLLRELLDEKFDDPMLGLLGAHLLLRDKPAMSPPFGLSPTAFCGCWDRTIPICGRYGGDANPRTVASTSHWNRHRCSG